MMKLLYSISKLFLIFFFITSCTSNKEVNFLVTSDLLSNLDSIKKQAPYKVTNLTNCDIGYSNLPMKLHNKRNSDKIHKAWDEIVNDYKSECNFYIDTINTKIIVKRKLVKWPKRKTRKQITEKDFLVLVKNEGIDIKDLKIIENRVIKYDDDYKQLLLEVNYKETTSKVSLSEKSVTITTYLTSQIDYWESQGYQFSTTTKETIEKYSKNKK